MRHEHMKLDFSHEQVMQLQAGIESTDSEYDDIFGEELEWWSDVDEEVRAMVISVIRKSATYEGEAAGMAMMLDQLTEVGQVFHVDRSKLPSGEFTVDVPDDSPIVTFRRVR